jgi:hypothetical protein
VPCASPARCGCFSASVHGEDQDGRDNVRQQWRSWENETEAEGELSRFQRIEEGSSGERVSGLGRKHRCERTPAQVEAGGEDTAAAWSADNF